MSNGARRNRMEFLTKQVTSLKSVPDADPNERVHCGPNNAIDKDLNRNREQRAPRLPRRQPSWCNGAIQQKCITEAIDGLIVLRPNGQPCFLILLKAMFAKGAPAQPPTAFDNNF